MELLERKILNSDTLRVALEVLQRLSQHEAYMGDAPEFNEGGEGYVAIRRLQDISLDSILENECKYIKEVFSNFWLRDMLHFR